MVMASPAGASRTPAPRSPVLTAEAVLLIVLGVAALLLPLLSGLIAATLLGVVLLVSGIVGLVSAFTGHAHVHRAWSVASALIALVVGLLVMFNPVAGALSLTLLIGAYLLFDGISLFGLALDQRRRGSPRWGWLVMSGIVDLILAALLVSLGALGSTVVVGFILGVDLIAAGIALLAVHRAPLAGAPIRGPATPAL